MTHVINLKLHELLFSNEQALSIVLATFVDELKSEDHAILRIVDAPAMGTLDLIDVTRTND